VKPLILYAFFTLTLIYAVSTTSKIEDSQKELSATSSAKKKTSRQLDKIASDIKKAEQDIEYLEEKIEILSEDQQKSQKAYEALKSELAASEKTLLKISKEVEEKHQTFISLLSEQFSVIFAMQQFKVPTHNSIISYEVYESYRKHNAKELESLKDEIKTLQKRKKEKQYRRDKTKRAIANIKKRRETYAQKKRQKERLLKRLGSDEEKYQSKLQQLVDEQASLRNTLAKLNILHKHEVEEARKRAAARREAIRLEKERKRKIRKAKAAAREKARRAKLALKYAKSKEARKAAQLAVIEAKKAEQKIYKQSAKVRQVHSSYKKSKIYDYRGKKTISPIPGARVVKRFGTYIDPVYKIKIFNESITLMAPSTGAKVQNVLNGKVVFAGKSSMLGKVVVVAHNGKLHTVYAGLSKIAPNIKVGRKIKRGYVVGKVAHKLLFQATKNSKHINPLKLINI